MEAFLKLYDGSRTYSDKPVFCVQVTASDMDEYRVVALLGFETKESALIFTAFLGGRNSQRMARDAQDGLVSLLFQLAPGNAIEFTASPESLRFKHDGDLIRFFTDHPLTFFRDLDDEEDEEDEEDGGCTCVIADFPDNCHVIGCFFLSLSEF